MRGFEKSARPWLGGSIASAIATAIAMAMVAAPIAGCAGSAPSTSIVLVVTADPDVRARAASVRLHVRAGQQGQHSDLTETRDLTAGGWPLRAVLVPRDGDASRPLQIEVDALDATGAPIARLAASPRFVSGQQRIVALHFEASCLGVSCRAGETCTEGRCAPPPVEPELPDAGPPMVDPECDMRTTWLDADRDGYGDPATMSMSCEPRPGSMGRGGDCDDRCPECHPGGREACDGARDEDCDGDVDEHCDCTTGELRPCPGGTEVGPCHAGTQACVGGEWSECVGRRDPEDESCNAIDDDCDGTIDDEVRRSCGRGCHASCELGLWGPCRDRDGDRCDDDD